MMRANLCSLNSFRFTAVFSRWCIPFFSLFILTMVLVFSHTAQAGTTSLTLAWEGSEEPGISYKLFCRVEGASFIYSNPVWQGDATTCTIQILDDQTCYFVVRACDDNGNESEDSNVVQFTPIDTDGDGLQDVVEIGLGTDPEVADTDGDGIDDGDELEYWGAENAAFLLNADVDGDGFLDGDEIANGSDPGTLGSTPAVIVYEDAEDGQIDRWGINGGGAAKASVENLDDPNLDSKVIALFGKGFKTRFLLQRKYGLAWHSTGFSVISWRMQYAERFKIEIAVKTESGKTRVMTYEPIDKDKLGRGKKVRFGLGSNIIDGKWYCFARDLQADLSSAQPDEVIAEVNNFQIRGSGRLDDIKLMATIPLDHDTDGDGLADGEETGHYKTNPYSIDSDGDGINDFSELVYWDGVGGNDDIDDDGVVNLLDFDSDGDGISDGQESEIGTSPADSSDTPLSVKYEDGSAEGLLLRWRLYKRTGQQAAAAINSIEDPDRGSVVELGGKKNTGYELSNRYGSAWRNGAHARASFWMKFSEKYRIEFEVVTDAGPRTMRYEPKDFHKLGRNKRVRFGLGSDTRDGQWFNFTRDLQEDLDLAQPGIEILEINYMRIRGRGLIDDVVLSN